MGFRLVLNPNPQWTRKRVTHFEQYKNIYFSHPSWESPVIGDPVYDVENGRFYEIYTQENPQQNEFHIGDVSLWPLFDGFGSVEGYEIDLSIYDDATRPYPLRSILREIVRIITSEGKYIEAVIQVNNPRREKLIRLCNLLGINVVRNS